MLLCDFLSRSAGQWPGKTAVTAGGRRTSYEALERLSNRIAHTLIARGLAAGDRVGLYLPNGLAMAAGVWGVLKAGGCFVPINPTTKADKLAYVLGNCAARGLLLPAGAAPPPVPSIEIVLHAREDGFEGLDAAEGAVPPRVIDIDLAAILYTSGSTGHPKGVALTHRNMISAAESIVEYLGMTADDVVIDVLPMSFDYGLYQALMIAKVGGSLVLESSFAYPYRIVQRVIEEGVTGFPGVPTVFAMLLQMRDIAADAFDGVRYVTNTGAALPPAHIAGIRRLFRRARVFSMYGITECKRVSYLPPEELDRRPGSVGRGMPNEDVMVVDAEGAPVRPGEVGELVVRGANVMQGYWGMPEETARVLRPGRYPWERVLYTGDLFRTDGEGYLYFVARKDDIIKSRGEKVSPREVENAICELEGVREAAVIGVPDPILGEAIKAFVVPAAGAAIDARAVMAHCARRLENFMTPKYVEFRDALPKSDNGKVRVQSLREEAPAGAGG